jgi:hypothetical protein
MRREPLTRNTGEECRKFFRTTPSRRRQRPCRRPENGVTVFIQGLEKRGPDNRRKRIYMSVLTPDLYRPMYGDKVAVGGAGQGRRYREGQDAGRSQGHDTLHPRPRYRSRQVDLQRPMRDQLAPADGVGGCEAGWLMDHRCPRRRGEAVGLQGQAAVFLEGRQEGRRHTWRRPQQCLAYRRALIAHSRRAARHAGRRPGLRLRQAAFVVDGGSLRFSSNPRHATAEDIRWFSFIFPRRA